MSSKNGIATAIFKEEYLRYCSTTCADLGRPVDPYDVGIQEDFKTYYVETLSDPEEKRLESFTAAELFDAEFPIEFLVNGVLVDGQPAVAGGPKKAMKTSTLMDLAISLASGSKFLGRFNSVQSNCGFISGESGMATLKETAIRVANARDVDLRGLGSSLAVSPTIPNLQSLTDLGAVDRFCEDHELRVLILDPAYLMLGGISDKASNVFAMGGALVPIAERALRLGVTPIVAHHSKSGRQSGSPLELDELAFTGWAEFARQWLLLSRREDYVPGSGEHRLWLNIGGSVGHGGLWGIDIDEGTNTAREGREWNVETHSVTDVVEQVERQKADQRAREQERQQNEDDRQVRLTLRSLPGHAATVRNLRDLLGIKDERIRQSIQRLQKCGYLEPSKVNRNNRTYEGFRLTE